MGHEQDIEGIQEWYLTGARGYDYRDVYDDEAIRIRGLMPRDIHVSAHRLVSADTGLAIAMFVHPSSTRTVGTLVQLGLPLSPDVSKHRLIRDGVIKAGGQVVAVPWNVLGVAEIEVRSIKVIDIEYTDNPLRADDYLFRANVVASTRIRDSEGNSVIGGYYRRHAFFLSGYDRQEDGSSYFLCELPADAAPATVEEAYESLKPASVKLAEERGMQVLRQGDMFFIRVDGLEPPEQAWRRAIYLHNSNHIADRVALHRGLVFVQGTIYHQPAEREADHKPLHLGRGTWLSVRNTVPVTT